MNTDPIQKAIDAVDGQSALARSLGITQGAVWQWLHKRRPLPIEHCPAIETATRGQVRCEELRPDVEWQRNKRGQVIGHLVRIGGET